MVPCPRVCQDWETSLVREKMVTINIQSDDTELQETRGVDLDKGNTTIESKPCAEVLVHIARMQ